MGLKALLYGGTALAIAGTILAGYLFVRGLQDDLLQAQEALGAMEVAHEVQKDTIDAQRDAIRVWQLAQEELERQLEELNNVTTEARREAAELRQFFADLDVENMEDGHLEAVARDAARRTDCLLEQASGASGLDCSGDNRPTEDDPSAPPDPG